MNDYDETIIETEKKAREAGHNWNPAAKSAAMRIIRKGVAKLYICVICGGKFEARRAARYCSNACRLKASRTARKNAAIAQTPVN
jgi:hypothetical protein